jgi:hypothetical protein
MISGQGQSKNLSGSLSDGMRMNTSQFHPGKRNLALSNVLLQLGIVLPIVSERV